jgi:hypothetical protein
MTPLIDVQEAWQRLHNEVRRLFEKGIIRYHGKLRPGQTIQVEVQREDIHATVRFEIKDHGVISFTHEQISNMAPRSEIHAYFVREDPRIPPYACYEHEDTRPYCDETILTYHLRKDVEIPDTAANGNGAAGGPNGRGRDLPPVIYPTALIDVSDGKVMGGKKGMPGPDSSEDEPGEDRHKLIQIAQAVHKGRPVTVTVRGQFQGYQQKGSVVLFQRDHKGAAPAKIRELLTTALQEIQALSVHYQTNWIPGSLVWTQAKLTREQMDITVAKIGKGITVTFGLKGNQGLSLAHFPSTYCIELVQKWFISFGAQTSPSDAELMQCLVNITVPWDIAARHIAIRAISIFRQNNGVLGIRERSLLKH